MSQQQRKQNLFGVQDWQTIYQTFRDADFKSYDYETLRKSMIDFLRIYNPENFNDYINSSEYIALIDLMAFMGQALSFRMDLNARENYLETARRTDSITRLAKLVNYEVKRNLPAQGYLKIETVRTDEVVRDVVGNNLANVNILWNDPNNTRWVEQWNTILNAAITGSQRIGNPGNVASIDGIQTSEYSMNMPATSYAPFRFTAQVDNNSMDFEVINPTIVNGSSIQEYGNAVKSLFNLLYRDDQRGYASNNTGYFLRFKQGVLLSEQFAVSESLPNRQIALTSPGINNNDVWLYERETDGSLTEWIKVPAVGGQTINYNALNTQVKKVFAVNSGVDDTATLIFGDGVFSEIPVGTMLCYYRVSNGLNYRINPGEMTGVQISIPYLSKNNRTQILSITASLKYTVANSAAREALADVKVRAPQNYYVQNRMVNGQDYNSLPFARYSNILKIKSVNRTSSGISRYLDVIDATGRYSSTNIVCDDGYLYKDATTLTQEFLADTTDTIAAYVNNQVAEAVASDSTRAYFYENYPATDVSASVVQWNLVLADNDVSSGYIYTSTTTNAITTNDIIFEYKFRVGAVLKFVPPTGKIFDYNNQLVNRGTAVTVNQKEVIYATVKSISNAGRGNLAGTGSAFIGRDNTGVGAIVLSEKVPSTAILSSVLPTYSPILPSEIQRQLVAAIGPDSQQTIGLGYLPATDNTSATGTWFIIADPDITGTFTAPTDSLAVSDDPRWLLMFQLSSSLDSSYEMSQRSVRYYFGSIQQTRFFYDPQAKVYDPLSGKLLKDRIDFLKTNHVPLNQVNQGYGTDITMGIVGVVTESDGFVDDTKIQVTFSDKDSDGAPDDPTFYPSIVGTNTELALMSPENQYVFFIDDQSNTGSTMRVQAPNTIQIVLTDSTIASTIFEYAHNDVIFAINNNKFYKVTRTTDTATYAEVTGYTYRQGRYNIKFQYRHNAPSDRRVDPSPSNIIDVYILEKNYADDYLAWVKDYSGVVSQPVEPTTESLRNDFSDLEQYRMISDLVIFSPARFKPLYGSRAEAGLRAKFVAVKNVQMVVSDSEIKSQIIAKVNEYFDPKNWEFGETVYFSELAAYLHTELGSMISSVHLVPTSTDQSYGDLQQVRCLPYEIPINVATVMDVEVVTNLTTVNLRAGN